MTAPLQETAWSMHENRPSPQLSDDDRSEENSESKYEGDTDTDGLASSSGHGNNQTPIILTYQEERALVQLQDALDSLVGNANDVQTGARNGGADMDCSAYRTACKECPDILQNPSFRLPFLRRFKMDPWAAAKRMVTYWTERQYLFGDAAFRPLTLAALPELFNEASIVLLPHRDKEGRSVIYLDRLKLNYQQLRDDKGRAQCLFYILDLAVQQNPTASTKGVVIVALIAKPPMHQTVSKSQDVSWWDSFFQSFSSLYEWKFPKHCIRISTQAVPIQVAMIHLCSLPASSGEGYLRRAAVNVCLNMLGSYYNNITKVHHGSRKQESQEDDEDHDETDSSAVDQFTRLHQASLLRQLRPFGLYKRQLPEVMGGLFTMQTFEHWVQRHSNQELRATATKEELLQRKRQVNLLHSRQKRQRRREELDELTSQSAQLKIENQHAKAEVCRLEALLRQANDMVRKLERSQPHSTRRVTGTSTALYADVSTPPAASVHSFASSTLPAHQDISFTEQMQTQLLSEPIPLDVTSSAPFHFGLLQHSATSGVEPLSQQALESPHLFGVAETIPFQSNEGPSETSASLPAFLLSASPKAAGQTDALFSHDHGIPSAADLCHGFSDDEDDHAFKNQIQDVIDPQPPGSLWSSMLGLFRPHGNATSHTNTSMNDPSMIGDHYAQHGLHSHLHHPTAMGISPGTAGLPGWQLNTTATVTHMSQQRNHQGHAISSDHVSAWPEPTAQSPAPPSHLTDYTDRSSPASSAVQPTATTSMSPMDADWYSW